MIQHSNSLLYRPHGINSVEIKSIVEKRRRDSFFDVTGTVTTETETDNSATRNDVKMHAKLFQHSTFLNIRFRRL